MGNIIYGGRAAFLYSWLAMFNFVICVCGYLSTLHEGTTSQLNRHSQSKVNICFCCYGNTMFMKHLVSSGFK